MKILGATPGKGIFQFSSYGSSPLVINTFESYSHCYYEFWKCYNFNIKLLLNLFYDKLLFFSKQLRLKAAKMKKMFQRNRRKRRIKNHQHQ